MPKRMLLLWMAMIILLTSCNVGKEQDSEADVPLSQGSALGIKSSEISETEFSPKGPVFGQMSTQINELMAQFAEGPGGVVMVIQNGKIVHQNGYGLVDIAQEIPITPETIFHLGSVGKQFTAMGVLILVDRGDVDLDAPISTYIPELDGLDSEVTVRRLLLHTSGVMGYDDSDEIYEALLDLSSSPENDDLLKAIAQFQAMLSEPGDVFHYSNTGYDLLGALIERVSGQTYAHFMDTHLFAPLGMIHTFALPNDRRFGDDVAQSYDSSGPYEPDALDNLNGSGSIYATVGDLYLYDRALYTEKLVNRDLLEQMFTSGQLNHGQKTNYGFGVEVATHEGYAYSGHQGSWLGFDAYYLRFPGEKLSVVVLLNLDDAEDDSEAIAFAIADLYLP